MPLQSYPEVCFTNLLGASQANQVDEINQELTQTFHMSLLPLTGLSVLAVWTLVIVG
jgi:hypothetical protein